MEVKKLPIFAKTQNSYMVVNFVKTKGLVATTHISKCLSSVTVNYDYNYPKDTFNDDNFEPISKKEFYDKVHEIQKNNGIKFSIKTK